MFAAPPAIEAEVFTEVPEKLRMKNRHSELIAGSPVKIPHHSHLEGPSFDRDGNFYCVDIAYGRIFRIDPKGNWEVVVEYDGWPNGLKFHRDGRIFVADYMHGLVIVDPEKHTAMPLRERYRFEHFKGLNDLVFASNGDLFFTDQGLTGHHDPSGRLFRLRADGQLDCVLDNVPSPNGLVLDLNEDIVFLAVTRANAIWRVPLMKDGGVAKVGTFIQLTGGLGPDGVALDEQGNLVVAHVGLGVVWLFSRRGEPMLRINSPRGPLTTNIAFGGSDRKTLFITETETGTILKAPMPVAGRLMYSHL